MNRIKIHEISNEQYYQIPKSLFTERYKNLSVDAKVVYAFLKDRMYLSQKNKWCDKNGDLFLLFQQQNIAQILGVSVSTVSRIFSALKKYELIDIIQQGLGKPNKIYIGHVLTCIDDTQTCTDDVSTCTGDVSDLHPCCVISETESSETDRVILKESTLSGGPDVAQEAVATDSSSFITPAYIVDYLNEKVGTNYRSTTPKTMKLIKARIKEGFTVSDFKTVIDKKCGDWLGDDEMVMYLRPETLFGTKFESYLNQKEADPTKLKVPISNRDKRRRATDEERRRRLAEYDWNHDGQNTTDIAGFLSK